MNGRDHVTVTRNHRRMRDNILSVWYGASEAERTEGADWYARAHKIARKMAEDNDTTTVVAAAVLSILSPSSTWSRNVRDAETMLAAWRSGATFGSFSCSTYGANKSKAWKLLQGKSTPETAFSVRAPKTRAFAELIADPRGRSVVVDGHALCIALGERRTLASVPGVGQAAYAAVADAYRDAADVLGVAPHVVQATTWLAWRNLYLTGRYVPRRALENT